MDFANTLLSGFSVTREIHECNLANCVSEKLFDAMVVGSIPIYIGAPGSLPAILNDAVIDLSHLERKVLHCPKKLLPPRRRLPEDKMGVPDRNRNDRRHRSAHNRDQQRQPGHRR